MKGVRLMSCLQLQLHWVRRQAKVLGGGHGHSRLPAAQQPPIHAVSKHPDLEHAAVDSFIS